MKKGMILGYLFLFPFLAVGCFTLYKVCEHVAESYAISKWDRAAARVLQVDSTYEVSKSSDGDSRSYYITGNYRYHYKGRSHTGTRIGVRDRGGMGIVYDAWEKRLRDKIASGEEVSVYVNPSQPGESVIFSGVVWDYAGFLMIFVITFGGVGAGGMAALACYARSERRKDELRARYPSEPWKWEDDWLDGVVSANAGWRALTTWAVAVFWNSISFPVAFLVPREFDEGNTLVLIALIFPLVGIALLYAAFRSTLRWVKYGRAEFIMHSSPGVVGGELRGSIRTTEHFMFDGPVALSLEAFKTVTRRSGGKSETRKELLWQERLSIDPGQVSSHTGIPVRFTIPYDCEETNSADPVVWKLKAEGSTPGTDFFAEFDVPVFKTADSNSELVNVTQRTDLDSFQEGTDRPSASQIVAEETGEGLLLVIPPVVVRSPGLVAGVIIAALVLICTAFITIYFAAPIPVSLVIAVIGLVLLVLALEWGVRKRRVRISASGVAIHTSRLVFHSTTDVSSGSIQEVLFSSAGTYTAGSRHQQMYKVDLVVGPPSETRRITIASMLTDKNEARWLVLMILQALGRANTSAI